jgi:predicted nucleotidyltransferase
MFAPPPLPELGPAFAVAPAVACAWVFGSVARGAARDDSDLDVAVVLRDRDATAVDHHRELRALTAQLEHLTGRTIDLVVLGLHDPILAQRVLAEGTLVFDDDRVRRLTFAREALARYFDWAPLYERTAAASLASNLRWVKVHAP